MSALERHFEPQKIVTKLCRRRLAVARRRRREGFMAGLVNSGAAWGRDDVSRLLPPRNVWSAMRPDSDARQHSTTSSADLLVAGMAHHAMRELDRQENRYRWVGRLRDFIDELRATALSWTGGRMAPSTIIATPKNRPGTGQKYRLLAPYSLRDSLLSSGFAAYLRAAVEPDLCDGCLAFRPGRPGHQPPTHNDAIPLIQGYRERWDEHQALWAAECDIQGFFDAVSHDEVRNSVAALAARRHLGLDARFLAFLDSFLGGYRYVDGALEAGRARLAREGVQNPKFASPLEAMAKVGIERPDGDIGVPQGSAVSCILANLILQPADEAVADAFGPEQEDGLYLRYCDDIIIVHPSRERSSAALDRYVAELSRLHLPVHPPVDVPDYGRQFWEQKSKRPYRWQTQAREATSVPWLAFVGYQVRRDGLLRVRKSTIEKELRKQEKVVEDLASQLARMVGSGRPRSILGSGRVRRRVAAHLISFGVGYPSGRRKSGANSGAVSWCGGFRELANYPHSSGGLRRLDRGRRLAIRRSGLVVRGFLRGSANLREVGPGDGRSTSADPADSRTVEFRDGPSVSYALYFARRLEVPPDEDERRSTALQEDAGYPSSS